VRLLSAWTVTGAVDHPYAFENFKVEATNVAAEVPIMVWRSVGNSHTEFARESALDELAIAAGRDPVDLRRDLLANNPRTLRAVELAAERAGWGSSLPDGRARGIACTNMRDTSVNQRLRMALFGFPTLRRAVRRVPDATPCLSRHC
jgi:isoquinoline 1-oxidoreductase subunit beta